MSKKKHSIKKVRQGGRGLEGVWVVRGTTQLRKGKGGGGKETLKKGGFSGLGYIVQGGAEKHRVGDRHERKRSGQRSVCR